MPDLTKMSVEGLCEWYVDNCTSPDERENVISELTRRMEVSTLIPQINAALNDLLNRPMGVVPDSAMVFYSSEKHALDVKAALAAKGVER